MKAIMKNSIKSLLVVAITFVGLNTVTYAEALKRNTVYVIKNMSNPGGVFPLGAYKVEDNSSLTDIGEKAVDTPRHSAVGLAVCDKNKRIFVSHEFSNVVDVVDAETFKRLSDLTIPGTSNIAGLVFSEGRKRLYAVDRNRPHIFVYTVDAAGNVVRVPSEEFDAAYGLYGVDTWDNKIYCTHGSNIVTIYDLDTKTEVDRYTTTSSSNMAIAVDGSDSGNVLVYTTWTYQSPSNKSHVTQYNINSDVAKRIDLGRDGRGLSVNPEKGLLYAVAGDNSDSIVPVLRTYKKDQFSAATPPPAVTPFDTEDLILGANATDVFASGVIFHPDAYVEMIDPAEKNGIVGEDITFRITIRNPSTQYPMKLEEMENLYNTNDISFVSSTLAPDDTTDDGNISWSGLNIIIPADGNYIFEKTFTALREVNCTTETIKITKATLQLQDGATQDVIPFENTLTFDIGRKDVDVPEVPIEPQPPEDGVCCTPELAERDSGSAFGTLSIIMLTMLTLLIGSLTIRRNSLRQS